jgi:hypothetical protein
MEDEILELENPFDGLTDAELELHLRAFGVTEVVANAAEYLNQAGKNAEYLAILLDLVENQAAMIESLSARVEELEAWRRS